MRNRFYSLAIPFFTDGALSMVQTVVPLLALRFGATELALGSIGWIAQVIRLPVCFASGPISEKTGRLRIAVPALCVFIAAGLMLTSAHSVAQVIVLYALIMASIGAFYPPFQALVGDVSARGYLTKNLSSFNVGWCVGGALAALSAGWLIKEGMTLTLLTAGGLGATACVLILTWRAKPAAHHESPSADAQPNTASDNGTLLLIARMGHFTGFFGFGTIRILFPKLGRGELGWSESAVAWTISLLLVGQAVGILSTAAAPWWRGKLWPQVMVQFTLLAGGITVALASSPVLFAGAFFVIGASQAVAYSAALYHGLSSRTNRGKNTGIHEGLVAAGSIFACSLGSLAAKLTSSARAPYVLFACLAAACILATAWIAWRRARSLT